ncbi:putative signal transducing protein [Roseivirga sp.]|uniref:putative signal transducing protein n=1 Tax=Roseivirga sp. TaxID=1964215 RepID=UPI003B8B487A
MSDLKLIYEGTDFESQILKAQLEDVGIKALLRSEANDGNIAGFGTAGSCRLFINELDLEPAQTVIEVFKTRNEA